MVIAADPDICIISVYLPCRENNSKDKFCEVISEIEELLEKYSDTHALFICGDFNSSLSRQPPNDRDQTLRDLIKKYDLHTDQDGEPTFFHAIGEQSAEIDYILKNTLTREISSSVVTAGQQHSNVSDHIPVSTEIKITFHDKFNDIMTHPKPRWSKCNKEIYRTYLQQSTKPIGCQATCNPWTLIFSLQHSHKPQSQVYPATILQRRKRNGLQKLEVLISKLQQESVSMHGGCGSVTERPEVTVIHQP
ncbi:hypothetical protein DPMN_053485 [Dreissena polymorpha]|uniref:Endonuclease/exonuclease/phosphatase domain-containing protein n=1 Tax=Dreissena polymorpha TaxID=45954 RepID=A0A9D4CMQ0_DREPO|nr:hypothetical protein DPMN_053485 [Dreissena polymorpha]